MYKHLDLFAGIGGFSLGLEATEEFEAVAFCEIEPYAQKVLKKHWPDVPIASDVTKLTYENGVLYDDGREIYRGPVESISGGFPCQDLSQNGNQLGFDGERSSLYRPMLRVVGECMPEVVWFENVAGLLTGNDGKWFAQFLYDLANVGYDAEWHVISSARAGLPNIRQRVWVIAYRNSLGLQGGSIGRQIRWTHPRVGVETLVDYDNGKPVPKPEFLRDIDGIPDKSHRIRCLGNSVTPRIPEVLGRAFVEAAKAAWVKI